MQSGNDQQWPTAAQLKKMKVGDLVTTNWHLGEKDVVRRVLSKKRDKNTGSTWRISSDGGEPCPQCKRPVGTSIPPVDGDWFMPYKPR